MAIEFKTIKYSDLNARQKENYNYAKISAALADYGYVTMRLSDDWQGADFIAQHLDGTFLKIQLKSRLAFRKDYFGKDLYVAFLHDGYLYLYPHDEVQGKLFAENPKLGETLSWSERGGYSFAGLSDKNLTLLAPYKRCPVPDAPCESE
jgi:hypothetical protein